MTADSTDKPRENRLRRAARRQGLRLERDRRRERHAPDHHGRYYLVEGPADSGNNAHARYLVSRETGSTLDEIHEILLDDADPGAGNSRPEKLVPASDPR